MRRLTSLGGLRFQGLMLGMAVIAIAGCDDRTSATELNPEGPPMVRQLIVSERVTTTSDMGNPIVRVAAQFAFGTHPQYAEDGDLDGNGEVIGAIARGNQQLRLVLDELLVGNNLEEIACADGTWSRVPLGATPDDISDCAGPELSRCTGEFAVCVGDGGPVGILDENEDGAFDDTRMLDGVVSLLCDGTDIPLDLQQSFYQPSGNQQIPAGPLGINGLGPALVLVPTDGLRTGAQCTLDISDTVVDKDNIQICAPDGGDVTLDCNPGDLSNVVFGVETLRVTGTDPTDGASNVALTLGGSDDAQILVQYNAFMDQTCAETIEVRAGGTLVNGLTVSLSANDASIVTIDVPGGYDPLTEYTVTSPSGAGGVCDQFGGVLPEDEVFTFTTRDATPVPDAGPMPDADVTPDATPTPDAT